MALSLFSFIKKASVHVAVYVHMLGMFGWIYLIISEWNVLVMVWESRDLMQMIYMMMLLRFSCNDLARCWAAGVILGMCLLVISLKVGDELTIMFWQCIGEVLKIC